VHSCAQVKQWMLELKSTMFSNAGGVSVKKALLCESLIEEESTECLDEIEAYIMALEDGEVNKDQVADLCKELADTIVVCNFMYNTLGADGDEMYRLVMENNREKTKQGHLNSIGKFVVSPDVKKKLKKKIHEQLVALL